MKSDFLKKCFVCQSAHFDHYFTLSKNLLKTTKCPKCGMVCVYNTPITSENIADFYSMDAYNGRRDLQKTNLYETYYKSAFVGYDKQDLTINQFCRVLKKIRNILGSRKKIHILDIGCATGVFLALAREKGFAVKGVEISHELADYAREKFGLEVEKDLMEAKFPSECFDVITLLDVIEHIPPSIILNLMAEVFKVLKKGGILVIRTPSEDSFLRTIAKIMFYVSFGKIEFLMHLFYSYEHILSFTPYCLTMFLRRIGFRPCYSRREEENPGRLNMPEPLRLALKSSYIISKAIGREHKILHYYLKG